MPSADETPAEGLAAIPEEPPTMPALPAANVRCFACLGEGMTLRIVERSPDGIITKRAAEICITCRGDGHVSRAVWTEWRATQQGRPR